MTMADAVEMVARLLTIVEDRERYRDDLDFENKRAEALSNEVLELRVERDAMRGERDRAIEERDLARRRFDQRRETEEAAIARAELAGRQRDETSRERDDLVHALSRERCAHNATRMELEKLTQVRDQVRSLVGVGSAEMSGEPTTEAAVRNFITDLRSHITDLRSQIDAVREAMGPWWGHWQNHAAAVRWLRGRLERHESP